MEITYSFDRDGSNPEILNLYKECYSEVFSHMDKHRPYFYAVAKDKDEIIGAMAIRKYEYRYRYLHVVVHPEYRKQGIADKLLHLALKYCLDDGAVEVENFKRVDSPFSRDRFDNMGFIEVSRFYDQNKVYRIQFILEVGKLKKKHISYLKKSLKEIKYEKMA